MYHLSQIASVFSWKLEREKLQQEGGQQGMLIFLTLQIFLASILQQTLVFSDIRGKSMYYRSYSAGQRCPPLLKLRRQTRRQGGRPLAGRGRKFQCWCWVWAGWWSVVASGPQSVLRFLSAVKCWSCVVQDLVWGSLGMAVVVTTNSLYYTTPGWNWSW